MVVVVFVCRGWLAEVGYDMEKRDESRVKKQKSIAIVESDVPRDLLQELQTLKGTKKAILIGGNGRRR